MRWRGSTGPSASARRPAVGGGNVATPPGGHPYDYDGVQRSPGEHAPNRFNFPSAPSGQAAGQGAGRPQQPYHSQQQPYEPPQRQPYDRPR
ncbi:hypothetical protein GT002_40545, partial [Streptomyces sp. SID4917]|nr:hypothetical protein [Streptomyces sp. SID4917]